VKRYLLGLLVVAGLLCSQTRIDLGRQGKRPDFAAMQETKPAQAAAELPSTCSVGQLFFKTGAGGAQSLYACVSQNRWEPTSGLRDCSVDENNNLSCPGDLLSGDASRPGELALYELPANGGDFISWLAPQSIPLTYRLRLPAAPPASGQVLTFSAPSEGVAQGSWTTPAAGGETPPPIDPSTLVLVDEFLPTTALAGGGAFGQLGWQPVGGGVNYKESSSTNPWPGLVELTSNGGVNQAVGIHSAGYGFGYPWFWNAAQRTGWEFEFAFKSDPYFSSQHITRVGLVNASSQTPSDGIWAEVVNNTGCTLTGSNANWTFVARSGGTGSSPLDSGIMYATNTYFKIRMRSVTAGYVLVSISAGGAAYSNEVALPITTTGALAPAFLLWGCDGQNHRLIVDRFQAVVGR